MDKIKKRRIHFRLFLIGAPGRPGYWFTHIVVNMKKLYFLSAFLLFVAASRGQLLSVSPLFPQDTSSISIVVDCSKGNQGLYNYSPTSDVYVHTGVITNLSTSNSDWRYVKYNQNFNVANPLLAATYLGANKYQFTIQGIRAYYGVPAGETILKIAILFRSGNGSAVQRNADGSDMYLPIYTAQLSGRFILPPFQPLFKALPENINATLGSQLTVKYASNKAAALNLYFNGTLAASAVNADSVQAVFTINSTGNQVILATASDGTNAHNDTIQFYVASTVVVAPLPAGVTEGINYLPGDTSVILNLYAPHKKRAVVIGDFNNWTQQAAYQMNQTPDSNNFWLRINGLKSGTEYAYQYVLDDTLTLADYNTEKVLDKDVDPTIPTATYPGLKAFPAGASGSLASVLETGKPAYNWQASSYTRPPQSNLVIYELLVRDFLAAGNWQTLMDTLGYLKKLGVNAIEVMPFTNFEGASSWGYNPNFYFAPDKVYGTETALKQFIDACHQQGMAVIMDMVMNHSFGSSPMVKMYWDGVNNIPAANSPWFNQYPTHGYNVGYQFNHQSQATITFRNRVTSYWLTNYKIDGFRWDLAKGFTQTRTCDATGNNCDITAWGNYDASRVATWKNIYDHIQGVSPGAYCILEMFADNPEETVEANYGMMPWGNMNSNFNQATMSYSNPSWDLSYGLFTNRGYSKPNLVTYQESHDEERLMYKNEQYGNASGPYNIKDTATGLNRNAMAAAFWAMMPGPKMMWQFGELGYDYSINSCPDGTVNSNCRLSNKAIRWDYLQNSARKGLHDIYARLFALRNLPANQTTFASSNISYSLAGPFKTLTVTDTALSVVVLGNFDVVPQTGYVAFPFAGTWTSYLSAGTRVESGHTDTITLQPGEYYVYTSKDTSHHVVCNLPKPPISWNGSQFSTTSTGVSYQWLLADSAIGGATASTYKPLAVGYYALRVTDSLGCTATSDSFNLVVTGIAPVSADKRAHLLPNPSSWEVVIVFDQAPSGVLTFRLLGSNGQVMKTWRSADQTVPLSLSRYESGMYYLQISGRGYDQLQPLVIQK